MATNVSVIGLTQWPSSTNPVLYMYFRPRSRAEGAKHGSHERTGGTGHHWRHSGLSQWTPSNYPADSQSLPWWLEFGSASRNVTWWTALRATTSVSSQNHLLVRSPYLLITC